MVLNICINQLKTNHKEGNHASQVWPPPWNTADILTDTAGVQSQNPESLPNGGLMLVQRRRRWPNINPPFGSVLMSGSTSDPLSCPSPLRQPALPYLYQGECLPSVIANGRQ